MQESVSQVKNIIEIIHLNDLKALSNLLPKHLDCIKDIGPYDQTLWTEEYCEQIYKLGNLCADPKIFSIFNNILNGRGGIEIYDFIRSEVVWNFFEQENSYNKDLLRDFINKYPGNPEFHHTYSLFLEKNNSLDKSMFELKQAMRLGGYKKNFIVTYRKMISLTFNHFLDKKSVDEAEKFFIEEKKFVIENDYLNSSFRADLVILLNSMEDRIKDHRMIANKISFFQKDIENTIQIQQRSVIEILGLFSAIIAFILTNINISVQNLSLKEMLILMFGMSLVLLIFVISTSYLFGKRYRYTTKLSFIRNLKFWSIIALFILLIIMVIYF